MAQAFGWTELGGDSNALKANGMIRSICTDAAGQVYAAGNFTNASGKHYVAKWDGIRWSELSNYDNGLNENYPISSLCTDGFNIYAVSSLNDSVNFVAKYWSGSWERLPSLTNSGILYPPNFSSICTDMSGNLYAGGMLYDTTGNHIAKWDWATQTWIKLPAYDNIHHTNAITYSVCTDISEDVYAAGIIFEGGCYTVIKWNGTNWSALDTLSSNGFAFSICTSYL